MQYNGGAMIYNNGIKLLIELEISRFTGITTYKYGTFRETWSLFIVPGTVFIASTHSSSNIT